MAKNYEEKETKDEKDFIEEELESYVEELTEDEEEQIEGGSARRYTMANYKNSVDVTVNSQTAYLPEVNKKIGTVSSVSYVMNSIGAVADYSHGIFVVNKKTKNGDVAMCVYGKDGRWCTVHVKFKGRTN